VWFLVNWDFAEIFFRKSQNGLVFPNNFIFNETQKCLYTHYKLYVEIVELIFIDFVLKIMTTPKKIS